MIKVKKEFLKKLADIEHRMLTKQCDIDDLIRKIEERNQEELWCELNLLIEEYKRGDK